MPTEKREKLLSSFVYDTDKVPTNYGTRMTLSQFLEGIDLGKYRPFIGNGYLIWNDRFIKGSKDWVHDRLVPFEGGYMTLEDLNDTVEGLEVFWVRETELIF